MVSLATSKDPLVDSIASTPKEDRATHEKEAKDAKKQLSQHFNGFISEHKIDGPFSQNSIETNTDLTGIDLTTTASNLPSQAPLSDRVLGQGDNLTLKNPKSTAELTNTENAAALLSDNVSADALTQASTQTMAFQNTTIQGTALQEKAQQGAALIPTNKAAETPLISNEFSTLTEGAPPSKIPKKDGAALESAPIATAASGKNLEATPTSQSVKTSTKTREGFTASDLSPKEAIRAFDATQAEQDAESDLDLENSMKEAFGNTNKGNAKASTTEKAFADTMATAAAKGDGSAASSADTNSTQSLDGKAVEAAFHRAPETGNVSKTATASSTQSSQAPFPSQTSATEQVAFSIKNNMAQGKGEINLNLRPDSLGRVNVKIDINHEGQTFVTVATERQDTRDMLQQDARQLTALLEDSGLEINEDNISYDLFAGQGDPEEKTRDTEGATTPQNERLDGGGFDKTSDPMIPLGLGEIRVPRHGGTWAVHA